MKTGISLPSKRSRHNPRAMVRSILWYEKVQRHYKFYESKTGPKNETESKEWPSLINKQRGSNDFEEIFLCLGVIP